jgi:hypothetical protein
MTSSQRVHLQELYDKKHLAVVEAYRANPHHPDFSKREFYNFLIEKYQDFLNVPRETILGKKS